MHTTFQSGATFDQKKRKTWSSLQPLCCDMGFAATKELFPGKVQQLASLGIQLCKQTQFCCLRASFTSSASSGVNGNVGIQEDNAKTLSTDPRFNLCYFNFSHSECLFPLCTTQAAQICWELCRWPNLSEFFKSFWTYQCIQATHKIAQSKPSHQIAKSLSNTVLIEGSELFYSCNV